MNYFTPERLIRLQDRSNETQFLAALDDWETAQECYRDHLNDLERELCRVPLRCKENLRRFFKFLAMVSLHDARVLDMYLGGRSRFRITLHPESQPGRLVILTYSLAQPPRIEHNILPARLCSQPIAWLYDEVSLEERKGTDEPLFCHTILLSDGSEVRLCFCYVSIERPVPLVPAVPADTNSP